MRCLGAVAAFEAEGDEAIGVGIIRRALQNAASIASLLLGTEAVICEIPAEKSDDRLGGMSPEGEMY